MQNSAEPEARCASTTAHLLAVRDGPNEGMWSHLSLMSSDDPEVMLITPADTHWSVVNASNLAAIASDGIPAAAGGAEPLVALAPGVLSGKGSWMR